MPRYREDNSPPEREESAYRPRRMREHLESEMPVEKKQRPVREQEPTRPVRVQKQQPPAQTPPTVPPEASDPGRKKPKKKRRASMVVLWICLIAAIIVFLVSGFFVFRELWLLPAQADSDNKALREAAGISSATESGTATDSVDFSALGLVNDDIVGWIRVPNTVIDYPVLQSDESDPNYYLNRDYKKNDSKYGSIFLDARNTLTDGAASAKSLTLYGHHMNDGRMFAALLQYGDLDFYKSAPVITFDTAEGAGQWKVLSVFKTNVQERQGQVFQYVRTGFLDENDFLNFVYQTKIRSILDTGVTVNEDDQLLVLSTCSYEYDDFRTVVVARKVRDGESPSVNTDGAAYNPAPLYPDCWYQDGGSKPDYPSTFSGAKDQGLTGWYDGKRP